MAVKFNNLDELTIKKNEALSHGRINEILYKLLQNDIDISPLSDFSPKIWECSWYNGSKNIIGQYGYKKGDAVWHNTEKLENFIDKNKDLIYFYAKNNDILKNVIKPFDPYDKDIIKLYISIINGYEYIDNNGNPNKLQRLFDIGEITNDVQIYVSLKDNNIIAPSDDNDKDDPHWKTFIKYNADNNITAHIDIIGKLLFLQHIDKYHYGITSDTTNSEDVDKILNLYLNKDLDNIDESAKQKMLKLDYSKNLNGFDVIKTSNKDGDKWYRLWNSGYLECGGTISIDKEDINSLREITFVEKYDYATTSESYYGLVDLFDFNNTEYDKSDNLNLLRYTVQITPINIGNNTNIGNYSDNDMLAVEATEFTNSGFKIKANVPGTYRYYVTGYKTVTL